MMATGRQAALHAMHIHVLDGRSEIALAASAHAARVLRDAIAARGAARLVAATGTSQLDFLAALGRERGVDWTRVELFHLDEYLGLAVDHPASFGRYVRERIVEPLGIRRFHLLQGGNPATVIRQVGAALVAAPIDLALTGIGENGHLAFNDPPADFETEAPYLIVTLDEACRAQQVGEGWFGAIADVPATAITMSIRQVLKSREIICLVPGDRKAAAVAACFSAGVTASAPASALQRHPLATVYLDHASAALLDTSVLDRFRA
jgi:glucosamine-6-phosphate deaminase